MKEKLPTKKIKQPKQETKIPKLEKPKMKDVEAYTDILIENLKKREGSGKEKERDMYLVIRFLQGEGEEKRDMQFASISTKESEPRDDIIKDGKFGFKEQEEIEKWRVVHELLHPIVNELAGKLTTTGAGNAKETNISPVQEMALPALEYLIYGDSAGTAYYSQVSEEDNIRYINTQAYLYSEFKKILTENQLKDMKSFLDQKAQELVSTITARRKYDKYGEAGIEKGMVDSELIYDEEDKMLEKRGVGEKVAKQNSKEIVVKYPDFGINHVEFDKPYIEKLNPDIIDFMKRTAQGMKNNAPKFLPEDWSKKVIQLNREEKEEFESRSTSQS